MTAPLSPARRAVPADAMRVVIGVTVLALTAAALDSQRELAQQAGMDDYIVKPFEMDVMVGTLLKALQRR